MNDLYKTLNDIEYLGMTIPKGSLVKLKFRSEHSEGDAWYEFLGLCSGLTKILYDDELEKA